MCRKTMTERSLGECLESFLEANTQMEPLAEGEEAPVCRKCRQGELNRRTFAEQ